MQENLKDILSHLNKDIDQETLLLYLQGKLSEEQKHEVEKRMMEDDFESEAMEGLESISNKKKLPSVVDQLNRDLRKKLEKKKRLREKLRYKDQPWIYFAILIILLLVIISYFILHKMLQG